MENYNRIEKDDIAIQYFLNDKLHRIDGPEKEWYSGSKSWYQNGKRHRINGPAVEHADGYKEYWIEGTLYSKEEFDKKVALLNNKAKMIIILVK